MMSDCEKAEEMKGIANDDQEDRLQASVVNKDVLGMNYNGGLFGTKEAPAIVQSLYSRVIVGCPGGAEERHDMVWFWLEKDKPHECPVCSRVFQLAGGSCWCWSEHLVQDDRTQSLD